MKIFINGKEGLVEEGVSLASVIEESKLPVEGLVVVIGDDVIPREKWDTLLLEPEMKIELLNFVSGG